MADGPEIASPRDSPFQRLVARWRRRAAEIDPATGPDAHELDPVALRQTLWGAGFVTPGGREQVMTLAAPLRLGPGMALLDVAAGIGGAVRALAERFRIEAHGLERDPELARIGMAMSAAGRLARRAPVTVYDAEAFDLTPGRYDCVLAREATHAVRDKERFLRVLMQGLKQGGALALTEFVLDRGAEDGGALARWAETAPHPPKLWTLERYEDCLKSLGFAPRAIADETSNYRALVLDAWTRFVERQELRRIPRAGFAPVVDEAERSLRLVQALESGALRLVRIHADANPR
ncbi:MAG TPA: class I SAM-dependent methyltransferase [Stellaceae bacterium]|nr:class I SAM-dependent methyltransferase [Stellaceae bacterium]